MQFSQGTKSNTEPFLQSAGQTNQTKTYCQNNSDDHGFLLGGEEGGGLTLVVRHLQTPSNSIERKSLMEFRNQKI